VRLPYFFGDEHEQIRRIGKSTPSGVCSRDRNARQRTLGIRGCHSVEQAGLRSVRAVHRRKCLAGSQPEQRRTKNSRGKEKSRRNALMHGIFANVTLLDRESRKQFDALLQGFRDYFQPEGAVEEVHVEELATLKWRARRLLQAERAEIQSEKKFNSRAVDREQQERGEAAIHEISTTGDKYGLLERRQNPLILGRALELLESLEGSIEVRDFDPENDSVNSQYCTRFTATIRWYPVFQSLSGSICLRRPARQNFWSA
jgi:hypothetical protein